MELKIENVEEKNLQTLADNPSNLVYRYVDCPVSEEKLTLEEVKKISLIFGMTAKN